MTGSDSVQSRRVRRASATIALRATFSAVSRIHATSEACESTIGGFAASLMNISCRQSSANESSRRVVRRTDRTMSSAQRS